jgi:alpha-1,6-mannosyltransferase
MSGRIPPAREPGQVSAEDTWLDFVLRSVVPGFIATILIAIGALGVGWLPLDTTLVDSAVVDALRSTTLGAVISKGAVVVGVTLLLQSWLLLGYDVLHGRVNDIRRLWLALGAWALPLMVAPPLFSRDVYSYFAQGKLMVAGIDPYTNGSSAVPGWFNDGVDPMWAEAPTPYGQFWLLLSRGVVQFTGPHPYSGALTMRLLAVAGVVMLAWAVPKIAYQCGISPSKALWLGVLNPLVLMHFVSGAHNDALMAGLVAVALAVSLSRLPILGILLATLAGSVKPIGLVVLPFIGLLWAGATATRTQIIVRWIWTGAISVAVLGVLAIVTGTGLGWLSALSTPGEVRTWLSPPTAVGMAVGGVLSLFGLDVTDTTVGIARAAGTLATLIVLAWLCLKPNGRSAVRGSALAFFVLVALGPVLQPWYLLWSLPLFAASGLNRVEMRVALVGIAGFTLFGLVTSSATQDSLVQVSDLLAVLIVAAVIVVLLAVSPRERRLILGDAADRGLIPEGAAAKSRAQSMMMRVVGNRSDGTGDPGS